MTGTDFCVNKPHMSWSYLNHLVYCESSVCGYTAVEAVLWIGE